MRRGLTLLELLVVLFIVVILAAILMPAGWSRPHKAARMTSCLSNEKQLVTGLLMYVQDYDDRLPPHAYVSGSRSTLLPALLKPYLCTDALWTCPSARRNDPKAETYHGRPDDPGVDYGYNGLALTSDGRGIPLSRVKHPEETIAFVEARSYLAAPASLAPALGGTAPVYRHQGMGCVAWLDGHIEFVKPGMLEANGATEAGKPLGSGIDRFFYWNLR